MTHAAVDLLCRYLRIDTTNPPGNEHKAAAFFERIFQEENITCTTYVSPSGRTSLRAVIPGKGEEEPIILLNHMDVVPAEKKDWSVDPFAGEVKDGFIYGRGALDMKCQGIMELLALLHIKQQGITPRRDIIFLATADEEAGGREGIQFLLDSHPEDFKAAFVINEGGYGIAGMAPDRPVFMVATAEKGMCWLKASCTGQPGHGSAPHGQNALEKLNAALSRLLAFEEPITITPVVETYFTRLSEVWDFISPYAEDRNPETLTRILNETGLLQMPQIAAMLRNTISLNRMQAGSKINVIPAYAEAGLDMRLLPGQPLEELLERIQETMQDDALRLEVVTYNESSISPPDTPFFPIIEKVIQKHYPKALVTPSLLFAASDSRAFRRIGIPVYGFCPAVIGLEDVPRVHGIDERISTKNMIRGTAIFQELIEALCM